MKTINKTNAHKKFPLDRPPEQHNVTMCPTLMYTHASDDFVYRIIIITTA